MLKRKFLVAAAICGTGMCSTSVFAGGGGIVFDPTNLVQNMMTAGSSVKTEMLQIEAAVRDAEQLENSIKNTVNTVKNFQGMGSIAADIGALQSQWNVDSTLMSQMGGQQAFVQNVMAQYSALGTNGTFTDYVTSMATASAQGQQKAQQLFQNYQLMTNEVQKTIQQRQAIAQKNTGLLGTNDAIAATNASLDNLSEINQATLQGITTLVGQQAYQQSVTAGQQTSTKQSGDTLDAYYKALQIDSQTFTNSTPAVTTIMGY